MCVEHLGADRPLVKAFICEPDSAFIARMLNDGGSDLCEHDALLRHWEVAPHFKGATSGVVDNGAASRG
jgi:hypothetical protein